MRQSLIENLESRRLMSVSLTAGGTLNVIGSDAAADSYSIYKVGSKVQVNKLAADLAPTGQTWSFDAAKVKKIFADGKGNHDYFSVAAGTIPATLEGGSGNDQLYAGSGNDALKGEAGKDTLGGGSGQDKLYGGDQDDVLYGNDGNDHLHGDAGSDYLDGQAGDDLIDGGWNSDTLIGGDGNNTLDYSARTADVKIDFFSLKAGQAGETDKFTDDFLIAQGGSGHDTLHAYGDVKLYGNGGNDTFWAPDGDTHLFGGAGDDTFDTFGEIGHAKVDGGTGHDKVVMNFGDTAINCEQVTKKAFDDGY